MTLEYIFVRGKGKHFFTFLLFAIMPAIALSFVFPPSHYITVFANYNIPKFASFGRLWLPLFNHPVWSIVILICGIILLVFAIASINSIIMRHFRVNDFSLPQLFTSTDENFFPSFAFTIAIIFLCLLFHTFSCLFIVLWFSLANNILGLILAIITILGCLLVTISLSSAIALWLPIMSFNGLPVFRALQLSFTKAHIIQRKTLSTNIMITIFCTIPAILAWLCKDIWILQAVFDALVYIIAIILLIPANFIIYCDVEGLKREDLIQSPYKRR